MKKVVEAKHCDPEFLERILKKIRNWFIRLRYALCAIPFLLSAGCARSIEEKPEATSTPTATAVTEYVMNNPTSTPEPTPTTTPMDASLITPVPTTTPIQIYIATEEEQKLIDKEAASIFKRSAKNFSDTSKYSFNNNENDESIINKINGLRGNFINYEDLENFNDLSDEQKSIIKTNIISNVFGFSDGLNYNFYIKITSGIENKNVESFTNPEIYKAFELLESDSTNFCGVETLKLIEEECIAICNLLNSEWDAFEIKARDYQTLVESVFINNDNEWNQIEITNFQSMSPGIKKCCFAYARIGLSAITEKAAVEGKSIKTSCYTSQLNEKLRDGTGNGPKYTDVISQSFSDLIDAYLAMKEQGVYDAYLTGDATRKAIIKHLCVKGELDLY